MTQVQPQIAQGTEKSKTSLNFLFFFFKIFFKKYSKYQNEDENKRMAPFFNANKGQDYKLKNIIYKK